MWKLATEGAPHPPEGLWPSGGCGVPERSGLDDGDISKLSGHKDQKSLRHYDPHMSVQKRIKVSETLFGTKSNDEKKKETESLAKEQRRPLQEIQFNGAHAHGSEMTRSEAQVHEENFIFARQLEIIRKRYD